MEDNQFTPAKSGSEEAIRQQEIAAISEEDMKKQEMARLEKKKLKKEKKKLQKKKKESKIEYDFEKIRVVFERLQLNWVKWNITCIALGFTAYKFYYARVHDEKHPVIYVVNGRDIGIFMISLGLITLLLATFQHRQNTEKLKNQFGRTFHSLSLWLSYVILVFSILILFIVISRS